jgi:hypothetical protein
MKYIKLYEYKKKVKVNHKKYVLANEINRVYKYSIYRISPYKISKPYVDRQNKLIYDIDIKQIACFDTDGKEMKKKDFAFDEVSRVADSYWIFNPNYNHLYYETDSLKDAKEMVQTLINAKKYNL